MSSDPSTDSSAPLERIIRPPLSGNSAGFKLENHLYDRGYQHIAGIDEAGRGPLAGPVVVAAVILDPKNIPNGLDDSKKLTKTAREQLYAQILVSSTVSLVTACAKTIDRVNIRNATLQSMVKASKSLQEIPGWNLVDGRDIPMGMEGNSSAIIKGDGYSQSIAAASIVAKVFRDNLMEQAHSVWPDYGFDRHKGYGTKAHLTAIKRLGACPLHRLSFAPLRK